MWGEVPYITHWNGQATKDWIDSMQTDDYIDKVSSPYEMDRGNVLLPAEVAAMVDNMKDCSKDFCTSN